jgi:hypothetical protein
LYAFLMSTMRATCPPIDHLFFRPKLNKPWRR